MLFAHLIPFSAATLRQLEHSNARQEGLMRLAENLTDPVVDPVFDPAGLVATRRFSADESSRLPLGELLAAHPAAVLLPSFATNGMAGTDRKFLNEHYVALADDLWILGKTLSFGGGVFEVIHPGRYRISTVEGSDLAGTYPEGFKGLATPEANGTIIAALDGAPLTGRPIELSKGVHSLQCSSNCQPAVVWIGPRLDRVHRAGPGDPQQLFVNLN
jgi:hypothetical protein